ncbi:MAG TPA: hypothetical protein VF980_05820 [Thermoanaerobaculia bacterium]
MGNRYRVLICAVLIALMAASGRSIDYERRLVPLVPLNSLGAFGFTWSTHAVLMYDDDAPTVAGFFYFDLPPAVAFGLPFEPQIFPTEPGEPPGSIIYVGRGSTATHVAAYIEATSADRVQRTALPIIRESDFASTPRHVLNAKRDARTRLMLRTYSLDLNMSEAAVRIVVMAKDAGPSFQWKSVVDRTIELTVQQKFTDLGGQSFAIRPLAAETPLGDIGSAADGAPLLISVTPVTPGLHIWAFVSQTNNATNEVQLFLPE